jgi:hypothetical protein
MTGEEDLFMVMLSHTERTPILRTWSFFTNTFMATPEGGLVPVIKRDGQALLLK